MTKDQAAAYVHAQAVAATCELEAMKAANAERERQGKSPAYGEEAFAALLTTYCIGHNDVLSTFANVYD